MILSTLPLPTTRHPHLRQQFYLKDMYIKRLLFQFIIEDCDMKGVYIINLGENCRYILKRSWCCSKIFRSMETEVSWFAYDFEPDAFENMTVGTSTQEWQIWEELLMRDKKSPAAHVPSSWTSLPSFEKLSEEELESIPENMQSKSTKNTKRGVKVFQGVWKFHFTTGLQ